MKKVAVIILNWNGTALLRRYLPTVLAGTDSAIADVIVADNGSTDDSISVLQMEFPQVKVLKFDNNLGFAQGYNLAIEQTMYPYTVLLNNDVRTPQGWLNPLLDYMEAHPGVGAVMPKLLHDRDDGKQMFEYAGAAGGYIDCHGYPYCRGRIFEYLEEDKGQYDDGPKSVFWATGACLMVRSQLYQDVGGLDKDFFAHMEEIDLCWRIRLAGSDLMMVPSSSVLLFTRRLMDTLAFGMAIAKFHFKDAWAIIRAHRDFRQMRSHYTSQPSVNLLRALPEERVNIITAHYLRGIKCFTDLKIE